MLSEEYNTNCQKYLDHKMTHDEFYLWVASVCHIGWADDKPRYMGRTVEQWAELYKADEHLNNVSLDEFDALYYWFKRAANRAGVHNSLSDCTCTHKAIIKARVLKYLNGNA